MLQSKGVTGYQEKKIIPVKLCDLPLDLIIQKYVMFCQWITMEALELKIIGKMLENLHIKKKAHAFL